MITIPPDKTLHFCVCAIAFMLGSFVGLGWFAAIAMACAREGFKIFRAKSAYDWQEGAWDEFAGMMGAATCAVSVYASAHPFMLF